jgi:SAM-dependent methyltransferase
VITKEHDVIVSGQFGPQADSYLKSAVHSAGEDLEQMVRLIGAKHGALALDMGCGAGHAAFRLAPLVEKVVACDLSASMLSVVAQEAKQRGLENLITQEAAAENLPFRAELFDLAVTRYSAHHWRDLRAGLAQMRRVMKTGGLAVFMDAIAPGARLLDSWLQTLELLRDPSHVRNYSLAEWQATLAETGFVPRPGVEFRLRLDFAAWIERMKTPDAHVLAIRSLQRRASTEVATHFAFEDDGSFTIDTVLIAADVGLRL